MNSLPDMLWIELRKAIRSRMPLWTALGSLFMPLGIAALLFLAKDPALSRKLGLVSAKADLMAYSATDWTAYLVLFAEIIGIGGFFFFIMVVSWVFGREFVDGTLKDMLAVPVQRSSILLAKFIVAAAWSAAIAGMIILFGLVMGVILQLPGGSLECGTAWNSPCRGDGLPGDCSGLAVCAFGQHRARLPAALRSGDTRGHYGEFDHGRGLGRIFPLGHPHAVCAGRTPGACELLDRHSNRAGGDIYNLPLVEGRRPELLVAG